MTRANLLKSSALSVLVAAALAGGCGSSKEVSDPKQTAGSSSAGKAGSVSAAGESSTAGVPATEGGSGGVEEEGGEAGALAGGAGDSGGSAGRGGSVANSGSAGLSGSSGGSGAGGGASKAGSGGTSGGSAGSAAAGSGGTSGGGGKAGGGGASGSGGSGGATVLFTPASANCASGNIDGLFSVCRNCHAERPIGAPISLVTYAEIVHKKDEITVNLSEDLMPPPGSAYSISGSNKAAILAWINAGAPGVPYKNGICPP